MEGREPSAFAGPVHVAFGAADGLVTPEIAGNIAKRFALSSIEAVPGCGHWPHAEHPELVAAILARFLGSLKNKKTTETRGGADSWAVGFDEHSDQAFGLALHPAVVFEASVLSRVMQGCERAQTILGAASRLYEALEFTRRVADGNRTYMEWEARFGGGERVAGVTILTTDAAGAITNIAIHHRPLPGLLRFSAELNRALAGQIEPDLFNSVP